MVTVDREKMSKSLGNFFTIREIFEKFPASAQVTAEVLRFFLLSTHYRGPIDFSDEALRQARAGLTNFYDLLKRLEEARPKGAVVDGGVLDVLTPVAIGFEEAMADDFNTPAALASLQRFRSDVNSRLHAGLSSSATPKVLEVFRTYGRILGLFQVRPSEWEFGQVRAAVGALGETEVERLIAERHLARVQKDWAKADAVRQELADRGITIEDRPDGSTRWKR
jgi:cysteinyl-tRNA synthetase